MLYLNLWMSGKSLVYFIRRLKYVNYPEYLGKHDAK